MTNAVRVLVVDDSSTMRHIVQSVLTRDPEITVVGQASSAAEARQAIKDLDPDVMTLDVEMPNMSGIEFLDKVMRLRPMPVVMVSTLTAQGTDTTLAALEIGAIDCVVKPNADNQNSFDDLPEKVKTAARAKGKLKPREAVVASAAPQSDYKPGNFLVAVGSSTGGVEALQTFVSKLPANCPPTVITQHMPPLFTKSLAQRLDRTFAPTVQEAVDGMPIRPGNIYLAPGGEKHLEIAGSSSFHCVIKKGGLVNGHCPSVDVLFSSVAAAAGPRAVGVILTGMGADGAKGLLEMRTHGASTLGQDAATSVVYGMPKAAFEIGAVAKQMPIEKIGSEVLRLTEANRNGPS